MKTPRRTSALAAPLILALACLALAACGSSSSTTTAASVSPTAAGSTGAGGAGSARFAAIRACLAKAGITLPQRPAGAPRTPGAGGGFFGGGGAGGAFGGANAAKVRAALQACGIRAFGGGGFRRNLASDPAAVAALTKFAACMRSDGINLPNPNTSGTGPVFNTSGLNTTSTAFRTAYAKCTPDLPTGFGRRGTTGASGTTTGPNA